MIARIVLMNDGKPCSSTMRTAIVTFLYFSVVVGYDSGSHIKPISPNAIGGRFSTHGSKAFGEEFLVFSMAPIGFHDGLRSQSRGGMSADA